MFASISTHLKDTHVSPKADWAVIMVATLVLTTVIVAAVVTPAIGIQAEVDLENARNSAAL